MASKRLDGSTFPAIAAVRAVLEAPTFEYNGVRKIVQSVGYSLPSIPRFEMTDVGYTKAKEKAIFRMYYNEAEVERVKALLIKRRGQAFSAISMSMRAGAKRSDSMGHCIEAIVFAVTKEHRIAEVVYRSTEVIRKFSADLWFLPRVFEAVGFEATTVKFYYTNAYLSGVFFPMLFTWWHPIAFLERLKVKDHKLFVGGTRFLRRSVARSDQVFPYSPENQQHQYFWKHHAAHAPAIRAYLKEFT